MNRAHNKIATGLHEVLELVQGTRKAKLKIPLHLLFSLAECLQYARDEDYGNTLSSGQLMAAEHVIRNFIQNGPHVVTTDDEDDDLPRKFKDLKLTKAARTRKPAADRRKNPHTPFRRDGVQKRRKEI